MNKKVLEKEVDWEKNKVKPYGRMSAGMRRVIDFQLSQSASVFETGESWEELRKKYAKERRVWNEGGPQPYKKVEHKVDGVCGEIPVRLYYPDEGLLHSAIVFIHGGGFTVGNNDTHDRMMRSLMKETGSIVIGIDYHLAPEFKFPTQIYECAEVVRYFYKKGENFGIDVQRMGLSGDSGGANLAMNTNLYLRDTEGGNEFIRGLILFYGSYGLEDSESQRLYGTSLDGMRRCDLEYYQSCYFEDVERDRYNPYFASLNNDLTYGIPPAYLCCGDLDPLLDDSKVLYEILKMHGVKTKIEIMKGCLHAYMHYGSVMEEVGHCMKECGEFWKQVIVERK